MNAIQIVSLITSASFFVGCASLPHAQGPNGPRLTGSGYATEYGQYAEVGVEFSSVGDFVALFSPKRWSSPLGTGGSLSWFNPVAWSDDPGRTGRILAGQVIVVGGVAIAAAGGGGGGGGSGTSDAVSGDTTTSSGGPTSSNPGAPPPTPIIP